MQNLDSFPCLFVCFFLSLNYFLKHLNSSKKFTSTDKCLERFLFLSKWFNNIYIEFETIAKNNQLCVFLSPRETTIEEHVFFIFLWNSGKKTDKAYRNMLLKANNNSRKYISSVIAKSLSISAYLYYAGGSYHQV